MDVVSIGAALAIVNKKLANIDNATAAANAAAQAASKAASDAQGWSTLTEANRHMLIAQNMHMSIAQAEMRALRAEIETLKAQVSALT